jgi:hypothetical protein
MKKIIIALAFQGLVSTYADFTTVKVKNFTGSYTQPDGRATASELIIPSSNKGQIEITVQGDENGYHLTYGENEYYFENPPAIINDIYKGTWKDVNYVTQGSKLNASIESFSSAVQYSDTILRSFKASCNENRSFENYGHQLIDGCLTNANLGIGYFKTTSTRKILNIFEDLPGVRASTTVVQDGSINISNGKFKMTAKVDIGMSAKVKIEGTTKFDVSKNRVAIRIDKAKASFINIKNKIFEELKKSESDTLKVQKPYIYILMTK